MRILTVWLAAALIVIGGCARPPPAGDPSGGGDRLALVVVKNESVSVTPEPARIGDSNGAIKWLLDSDGSPYVFTAAGITFSNDPGVPPAGMKCESLPRDPDTYFNCPGKQGGGTQFKCNKVRKPTKGACFKYNIQVLEKSTFTVINKDPWVIAD